jgi:hypothetical protein
MVYRLILESAKVSKIYDLEGTNQDFLGRIYRIGSSMTKKQKFPLATTITSHHLY